MIKILNLCMVVLILLLVGCSRDIDPKYYCTHKGDCQASTDTCECVTEDYYTHIENNTCDSFGCDCINNVCTKTPPYMK